MKSRSVLGGAIVFGVLVFARFALASEFVQGECNGKTITKGEAMRILMNDPKAVVVKVDRVVFDNERGTLRNKPK